jgi:hypothetical protein
MPTTVRGRNGPSAHYWQRFLEVVFQGKTDLFTVLRKVRLLLRCIARLPASQPS